VTPAGCCRKSVLSSTIQFPTVTVEFLHLSPICKHVPTGHGHITDSLEDQQNPEGPHMTIAACQDAASSVWRLTGTQCRALGGASQYRACQVLGQHRSTQRKAPHLTDDEVASIADIIELGKTYGLAAAEPAGHTRAIAPDQTLFPQTPCTNGAVHTHPIC
jgi:hypothetical protein